MGHLKNITGFLYRKLFFSQKYNRDIFYDPTEDIRPCILEKKYDSHVQRYQGYKTRQNTARRIKNMRKLAGHKYVPYEFGKKRKRYFKGNRWGQFNYLKSNHNWQGIFGTPMAETQINDNMIIKPKKEPLMNSELCIVVIEGPEKENRFYGFGKFSKEYPDAEKLSYKKASEIALKWKGKAVENYGLENEHVAYDATLRTENDRQADKLGLDEGKMIFTWTKVSERKYELTTYPKIENKYTIEYIKDCDNDSYWICTENPGMKNGSVLCGFSNENLENTKYSCEFYILAKKSKLHKMLENLCGTDSPSLEKVMNNIKEIRKPELLECGVSSIYPLGKEGIVLFFNNGENTMISTQGNWVSFKDIDYPNGPRGEWIKHAVYEIEKEGFQVKGKYELLKYANEDIERYTKVCGENSFEEYMDKRFPRNPKGSNQYETEENGISV